MTWTGNPRSSTAQWRRTRRLVLERDRHRCTEPDCNAAATEVHHIVDWADGGTDDPPNLRAICTPHHARLTAQRANAKRWTLRRRRAPERHPGLR